MFVVFQTIVRFRAGGDEGTAALLERTVYPEEVTHCAAGVRWLTWLHSQAHAGAEARDTCGEPTAGDSSRRAGAGAARQAEPEGAEAGELHTALRSGTRRDGGPGHANQQASEKAGEPGAALSSRDSSEGDAEHAAQRSAERGAPGDLSSVPERLDWMAEGRRYATVEAWFHDLVRKHFWGGLKAPFNESARHEAGLMPSWYLPLAKLTEAGKP